MGPPLLIAGCSPDPETLDLRRKVAEAEARADAAERRAVDKGNAFAAGHAPASAAINPGAGQAQAADVTAPVNPAPDAGDAGSRGTAASFRDATHGGPDNLVP